MFKKILIFFLLMLVVLRSSLLAQPGGNGTCSTADPFCGSSVYTFPSGGCTSNCIGQTGPCYSCMSAPNNPAWYYLQIATPGTIILSITESPYTDIDFCCWGPFSSPTGACTAGLTCSVVVSCSFSPSGNETCTIPNALPGQFYMLVLSNFVNAPTQVSFLQSNWGQPGAGSTNCNLVSLCTVSSITANPTTCNSVTNTFSVSGSVEFSNAPSTGTLIVTDITTVPNISQTFSFPFASPRTYNLTNIPCDGLTHTIKAHFSDSTNCFLTHTFPAPPAECPAAVISGGGVVCNNGTNTGSVYVNITGGTAPYTFTYAINGVPQIPVTNYSGPFPYIITVTASGTYTMVSVSGNSCIGTVSGNATVSFVPLPVVGFTTPLPVCINDPPFALTGGTPIGGNYSGPGVSGGSINPLIAGPGTHILTYIFADANNCNDSAHAAILVGNKPVLTNIPLSDTICSAGAAIVTLTSNVTGTSFSWTASLQSGNVTGFSNGSETTINNILTNNGVVNGVVKYTIHLSTSICTGNDTSYYFLVRPVASVTNNPLSSLICSGIQTNILLLSNVTGASFSWTASGSSGNVTGFSNGSGSSIKQTLVNSSFGVESVTYHTTPSIGGCPGIASNYMVTVNSSPVVTNEVCFDSITTISAKPFRLKGGQPIGGTYSGAGVSAGVFYPAVAGIGNKTITYTYSNLYGCIKGKSETIIVNPSTSFTCGNPLTDIRDGKSYSTVKIGTQCWMAENLNYGYQVSSIQHQRDNCVNEKYCYQNLSANCAVRGANYQWDEVMNYDDTPG
ncbi:MAG: PKD-like domain-containing protein, partial [Bacteroidota bacterium]